MTTISVRLNKDEEKVFTEYAKLTGIPLSTLFKSSLEEKIEDEFDLQAIKEYENDVKTDSTETYDHEEVLKMLGL